MGYGGLAGAVNGPFASCSSFIPVYGHRPRFGKKISRLLLPILLLLVVALLLPWPLLSTESYSTSTLISRHAADFFLHKRDRPRTEGH